MALSWDSIRALLLFFGPVFLPKVISYCRSLRSDHSNNRLAVRPVPAQGRIALSLLLLLSVLYLFKSLPAFAPENLFALTQSRLQIPADTLFNRVATLRPGSVLSWNDEVLRAKFKNLESKLLYLQFGPSVLSECLFCNVDEPRSYFWYALPQLLWPHLANLIVMAAVTSPSLTESYGMQWRAPATILAATIAGLDVYSVGSYNHQINARALRLHEIDFFFWSMHSYRLLALAALDALLGWVLYLSATNRAFALGSSPSERVESVGRAMLAIKSKVNAIGITKNTTLRDDNLRSRSQAYWAHEVRLMREVMEERLVIQSVNDALLNRIDIQSISNDAQSYTQSVLRPLSPEAMRTEI